MQDLLMPSPTRCMALLSQYIPELAIEKQRELSDELIEANEKLSQYPSTVDEYVDFNLHLNKVDAALPNLDRRFVEIQEMAEIIREYGIRVEKETRAAFSDLA